MRDRHVCVHEHFKTRYGAEGRTRTDTPRGPQLLRLRRLPIPSLPRIKQYMPKQQYLLLLLQQWPLSHKTPSVGSKQKVRERKFHQTLKSYALAY